MKQHTKVYMPDWFCPICQFKIFGSKDTCFKCGTTRSSVLLSTKPKLEERKYKESIQEVSEQIFELGNHLSIRIICRPYHLALYSSCLLNSYKLNS